MFKRVLVPLDGSQRAERAIAVAARMARMTKGSIVLAQVVSVATELWPYVDLQTSHMQAVVDAELLEAAEYLKKIASRPELEGITTDTVVMHGPTASTILSIAHSHAVDLIIICSHGYTGMTRWVMGSVADKIARHSVVPVLILREGGPLPGALPSGEPRPLRVLVPLDGSKRAMVALLPAASLISSFAAPGRGTLHLVRIVKPVITDLVNEEQYPFNLRESEEALVQTTQYLNTTADQLRNGNLGQTLDITWSALVDTDIARGILRIAEHGEGVRGEGDEKDAFDVITIATHGHGGMHNWVTGSVSQRVLNGTRLPLLIVRPPDMIKKQDVNMEDISVTTVEEIHTLRFH